MATVTNDRAYWTARLAFVLREVHHARYLSLRVVIPPWWQFWRSYWIEDGAGNRYDAIPREGI